MKKILLVLSTATCLLSTAFAQDIHFTQFYMSPLVQNPALTGCNYDMQAIVNYKDQWKTVATPYKTIAASYDMRIGKATPKNGYWAAGILFYSDKAGDASMKTTNASLNAAYHVLLGGNSRLSLGVQPAYCQRAMSFSELQWGNQYQSGAFSSTNSTGEPLGGTPSYSFFDVGAGMMWSYEKGEMYISARNHLKMNIGFSAFHLTEPKYSYYATPSEKLYRKYTVYANANIGIKNSPISFVPGMIFNMQGSAKEFLVGGQLRYLLKESSKYTSFVSGAAISFGGFVRTKDALALTMLLEFSKYSLGFSYDVNTSDLRAASNQKGGFEISLKFVNPNPFLTGKSVSRIN